MMASNTPANLQDLARDRDWVTRKKVEAVIERYTYDVQPASRRVRHMDCHYGRTGWLICTCGLLRDLMRLDVSLAEALYPNYLEERSHHQHSFSLMPPA